ncbi:hypothetical protein [Promicromonospora soli]
MTNRQLHGQFSPRTRTSFMGFERSSVRHPWPVVSILRWWHRGTFLVHWPDVAQVPAPEADADPERDSVVMLRAGYTRYDAAL